MPGEVAKEFDSASELANDSSVTATVGDAGAGQEESPVGARGKSFPRCADPDEVELAITEARSAGFGELVSAHDKDIKEELFLQAREHKTELERVEREARRREALLQGHLRLANERAKDAEAKFEQVRSGEERRALERRIMAIASEMGGLENVQRQLQTALEDSKMEVRSLKAQVATAEQRLRAAELARWRAKRRQRRCEAQLRSRGRAAAASSSSPRTCSAAQAGRADVEPPSGGERQENQQHIVRMSFDVLTILARRAARSCSQVLTKFGVPSISALTHEEDVLELLASLCPRNSVQPNREFAPGGSNCTSTPQTLQVEWMIAFACLFLWRCLLLLVIWRLSACNITGMVPVALRAMLCVVLVVSQLIPLLA